MNISWTAPFFPTAGQYNVYHTCRENRNLFSISSSGVSYGGDAVSTKFTYLTRPFDSKTITFEIKGITLDDAGYYNGGPLVKVACSGGGVVLIVSGRFYLPFKRLLDLVKALM